MILRARGSPASATEAADERSNKAKTRKTKSNKGIKMKLKTQNSNYHSRPGCEHLAVWTRTERREKQPDNRGVWQVPEAGRL